ncbi:MAG: 3-isopropylmalate dehydratase small subunit [Polyangiaceae bacterium]|jgi:3-isopropylmalate/(R)-2-methylmalate dehydratase small subunit
MEDSKRVVIEGRSVPLVGNDIDTDRIIPARFLKCVVFDGLGEHAFEDDRTALRAQGTAHPFDDPRFEGAQILVVNKNFGCGSSREHAPQALRRWGRGIRAIVGESFAEIFHGNCVALGIPCVIVDVASAEALQAIARERPTSTVRVDLLAKTVTSQGFAVALTIAEGPRRQFVEGRWDSTAELLASKDNIRTLAASIPYFNQFA